MEISVNLRLVGFACVSVACPGRLSEAREWNECPLWLRIQLIRWLREALTVALFNAAHGSEQMGIRSCAEGFKLAVEHLHDQRIENTHFCQCRHFVVDAGECCVQLVKKIVNKGVFAHC